jgi:hypothetical protein
MQKADLEEKWREIQQTKLSRENQRQLGDTQAQTSRSQEFAALDRINKQKEAFHTRSASQSGPKTLFKRNWVMRETFLRPVKLNDYFFHVR